MDYLFSRKAIFSLLAASYLLYGLGAPSPALSDNATLPVTVGVSLKSAMEEAMREPLPTPEPAPVEFELGSLELTDIGGTALKTKELKKKRVVIYFWSIYCRSCVGPLNELNELRKELAEDDVELLTVHLFEPKKERVLARVAKLGLSLPIALAPKSIRDLFSVRILPTSIVLDQEHKVIARFDGNVDSEGIRLSLMRKVEEPTDEFPLLEEFLEEVGALR